MRIAAARPTQILYKYLYNNLANLAKVWQDSILWAQHHLPPGRRQNTDETKLFGKRTLWIKNKVKLTIEDLENNLWKENILYGMYLGTFRNYNNLEIGFITEGKIS